MYTLGTYFDELLRNLRPPQERLDAARDIPPLVRAYLEEHQEFATVFPHSRLVGSYGQDASVGDVKDVDFLVRVDGDPEENEPQAKQLIQDLKKPWMVCLRRLVIMVLPVLISNVLDDLYMSISRITIFT